jgi:hypothetical protein
MLSKSKTPCYAGRFDINIQGQLLTPQWRFESEQEICSSKRCHIKKLKGDFNRGSICIKVDLNDDILI